MDYTTLLTSEHADKPKLNAMITAVCKPLVDLQSVYSSFSTLFDLATAVGDQLDKLGEWIGQSRTLYLPATFVAFAFDTTGQGFDQAYWISSMAQQVQYVTLSDNDYRLLLSAKALDNAWKGSVDTYGQTGITNTLYELADSLFTPLGFRLNVIDYGNLTMQLHLISTGGTVTNEITALFEGGVIKMKPAGITVTNYVIG